MRFTIRNPLKVPGADDPVAAFEEKCIKNSECVRANHKAMKNETKVLCETTAGDLLERTTLVYRAPNETPAHAKLLLGAGSFDFTETVRYDFTTHTGQIEASMCNQKLKSKIKTAATMKILRAGPLEPRTIIQEIDFELDVNIWLIGGKVAHYIKDQIEQKAPESRQRTQDYLDQHVS